ncbi:DUF2059 domain-containing protein [Brevundimonas balnearis]|uniref:DUF2059 domain-containing protein n=1 Tax=Brevundimonas balnearis TaxID=1572858 RepID=A0ABV6R3H8_9CAUL
MLKILLSGVLAAALLGGAAQAREAGDNLAEREALAQRYIALSTGENLNKVFSDMADAIVAEYPDPDGPEAQWMRRQLPGFAEGIVDQVAEAMAPEYARRLTLEELTALVAFFDTPMGREILRKSVVLAVELQPTIDAIAIEEAGELLSKFCAEFDCTSAVPLAPAKS